MNIKRKIEVKNATYDITGLNQTQFQMLRSALEQYLYYIRHSIPEEGEGNEAELYHKLRKMAESEEVII